MDNIGSNSKIRVEWKDLPENYTSTNRAKIKTYFSRKYGVDKSNISINFVSSKKNEKGELIELTDTNLDNILDTNYQHQLFKVWLEREGIDANYDKLIEIDKIVSQKLVGDYEMSQIKKWSLEWLKINNFLAYGNDNTLNVNNLKGLSVVSSIPENQGGKSTLIVDAILFLFLGKTTKTDKNEEIFNRFSSDNTLNVKGLIDLSGDKYVIKRTLTRKPKSSGGWTVSSVLDLKKFMPDGTEIDLKEAEAISTTNEIKKMVGNEETFNLTVLATGDNLMDLVCGKPTENGKLLNKLIGLSVIEEKEAVARKEYNDWKKTKLSNRYDIPSLIEDNDDKTEHLDILAGSLESQTTILKNSEAKVEELTSLKETLLKSTKQIELDTNKVDKNAIEESIKEITTKGKAISERLDIISKVIDSLMGYSYDEVAFHEAYESKMALVAEQRQNIFDCEQLIHKIEHLENSEFCSTCSQPLPDVDNTEEISKQQLVLTSLDKRLEEINELIKVADETMETMRENKLKYDERNTLELEKERLLINKQACVLDFKSRKADLKFYEDNVEAIEFNNDLKLKIDRVNTDISVLRNTIATASQKINDINNAINLNNSTIKQNLELIDKLNEEAKLDADYNTYIKMVGRNGITKIVIRSLIPLINAELDRIMEDSLDMKLIFDINDKNEVELIIDDDGNHRPAKSASGYEKTISALALRAVLTKVSQLPTPNFVVFDEIFGKVSPANYERVYSFFDKIKHLFDNIFLIVHDERLKDWGDHQIVIKKENKISKIIT